MVNNLKPTEITHYNLDQFLKVYEREPLGHLLCDKLRLPLSFVYCIFVFVYFGVLLSLHTILKTPYPATIRDVFQYPSTTFYYPNILGIAYDLIGNPIQFVLLVFLRKYICSQFLVLSQDDIVKLKPASSKKIGLGGYWEICSNLDSQAAYQAYMVFFCRFSAAM
jgi:hypothetical protein